MKILITGAHFTPAMAVIDELKKRKDYQIVYIGRKTTREGDSSPSVEARVLPALGIKYQTIITGRLQRNFNFYTILSLLKIPIGLLQSFYLIAKERPNVILSFGGYVAVPLVISAWFLSIPIVVHEQTLVSGLANTISSLFADKMALTFDPKAMKNGMNSFVLDKAVVTGNPLRKEILERSIDVSLEIKQFVGRVKQEKLPLILVTGGNQGSHVINKAIEENLSQFLGLGFLAHQTGDSKYKNFERIEKKVEGLKNKDRLFLREWIDTADFAYLMKEADLVISRAGANTLLELAFLGVPTIAIPIPFIFRDEQNINAGFFQNLGLTQVLPQSSLSSTSLLQIVKNSLKNIKELRKNAKNAKKIVIEDGAKRLALEVEILATSQKGF